MQFERWGVVAFFGIFIPGAYLTAVLILGFAGILELVFEKTHTEVLGFIETHLIIASSAFFFMSYLLGVVIRLFDAKLIDGVSTWYLRNILRKRAEEDEWIKEYGTKGDGCSCGSY